MEGPDSSYSLFAIHCGSQNTIDVSFVVRDTAQAQQHLADTLKTPFVHTGPRTLPCIAAFAAYDQRRAKLQLYDEVFFYEHNR